MSTAVAAVAGLLVAGGLLLLASGLTRRPARAVARPVPLGERWGRVTRRPPGPAGRRRDLMLVGSVVAGFAVAAWSGWLVAVVAAPVLVLGLPYLLRVPPARDAALLEALDRWVRAVSATLATGASVTDAIRTSRRTAPPLLAEDLELLVARLNHRWDTGAALRAMADTLDSPDADAVLAAMVLASRRGADGASVTLQALADSIQATLQARRAIEVERAKPYVVVRQVTVISLVALLAVFVTSPGFFDGYRSPLGQLVLAVLGAAYLGSLLLMRRRAEQDRRPRLLVAGPT